MRHVCVSGPVFDSRYLQLVSCEVLGFEFRKLDKGFLSGVATANARRRVSFD